MPPDTSYTELKALLEKNRVLLEDNNKMLHKIRREALIGLWIRIGWYVVLIGLPFALYFYILEPYFTALGSSYEVFSAGIQEIPGWKQLNEAVNHFQSEAVE